MALNFPDNPSVNDVYTDTTSGFSYQWDGTVWISFSPSSSSQIRVLDDISGSFDDVTQVFTLTSSGSSITPASAQSLIINLGGIVQDPTDDYSVSGSNIIFSTAPSSGLTFSGVSLGPAIPINTLPDGSVTPAKLSTGGPSWNTSGGVYISGITTITNSSGTVTVGIGTTALLVEGNARVTGILTVGTGSITIDGTTNKINVGTGLTLTSSGIVANIITASSFIGNLTGTATAAGTATTATAAGTAYNLTGSPNITVGITTVNGGINLNKLLRESVNIIAGRLSSNTNIDLENGMVHYFTTTENTTSTPNIRYNASTTLNSSMDIGDTIAVSIITTAAAAGYSANITIDGSAVTEEWLGGSAPTSGGSSGFDVYAFQIIKTANATFTVLASVNNFA